VVAQVILTANPGTIRSDGVATSDIVATAKDNLGNPVAAPSAITVSISVGDPAICTTPIVITTIALGATDSSASPARILSTTTPGACAVSGSASGGYTSSVTGVTVNTTNQSISLPASVLAPPGGSADFTVSISPAAPVGGLTVNLSTLDPSVASVTPSILIPAGVATGTATLTGLVTGQTTLSASATGYATRSTIASVKVITIGFSAGSLSFPANRSATAHVVLSDAAPPGGLVVALTVADTNFSTVSPASVVVPAGQLTSADFAATGVGAGNTTLTASSPGATSGAITLYVGAPTAVSSFYGNVWVGAGMRDTMYFFLNAPADPGGVTFSIASDNAALTVSSSVFAAAGTSSYIPFTMTGVSVGGPVTITVSAPGWTSGQVVVNVAATTLVVDSLENPRTTLSAPSGLRVWINTPNCGYCGSVNTDLTVNLAITPSNIATITPSLVITAGAIANSNAVIGTPASGGTYTVTASALGFSDAVSAVVTVNQPSVSSFYGNTWVGTGMQDTMYFFLSNPAPTGGVTFSLASDNAALTVPGSVLVAAGSQSYIPFTMTGVSVGGPVTITVSSAGWTSGQVVVNVAATTLVIDSLENPRTTLTAPSGFRVWVNTPNCGYCGSVSADLTVNLAITPSNIATITPSVIITAGTVSNSTAVIGTPGYGGTYTVTASALGFSDFVSAAVTVNQPSVSGFYGNTWVGTGMQDTMYFFLSNPAPTGGVTFSLASDNAALTVPGSVLVAAGTSSYIPFTMTGVSVGGPVTITVSSAGWTSGQVVVNVAATTLVIDSLENPRTTLTAPSGFRVWVNTPNCGYCGSVSADLTVNLAITPSNIATITPSVIITAGTVSNSTAVIGTPGYGGTYTVTASALGFSDFVSAAVTVSQPSVSYFYGDSSIGTGMQDTMYFFLSNPAPTGGVTFSVGSTDPSIASVPATVVVASGGQSYLPFTITGLAPGSVTVTVSALGWSGNSVNIDVGTPYLVVDSLQNPRTTITPASTFRVWVGVPGCGYCGALSSDLAVTLALGGTPTNIASLGSTVLTIAAGTNVNSNDTVSQPTAAGTYSISASAPNVTGATSATVTVTLPFVTSIYGSGILGAGTYAINPDYFFLSDPAPIAGVTFTLTMSNRGLATATGSVPVAAGAQTYIPFNLAGLAVGSPTVTISAPGWQDYVFQLQVVQPTFGISGLATTQTTSGSGSPFTVTVETPGCGNCDYVTADTSVSFSVSGTPSNIVAAPAPIVILAGTSYTATSVGAPTATGTYNLIVSASGFLDYTSASVSVPS
jgi:hypothetical protein